MKRRTLSLLLVIVMLLALVIPASAADGAKVQPTVQAITLDGKDVTVEAYNIDGYNYLKLRDVAQLFANTEASFSVSYDEAKKEAAVLSGRAYTPVGGELETGEDKSDTCVATTQSFTVNGRARELNAYNIGGYNYLKLRDLGALLGFGVDYDEAANIAILSSALDFELELDEALANGVATKTTLTPKLDGEDITVDWYVAPYTAKPNRAEDQFINIYIPSNATKDSPIMFYVNNGGWQSNSYPTDTVRNYGEYTEMDRRSGQMQTRMGGDYKSTGDDKVGVALKEGYVIVSYGCRSRNNGQTEGEYLGHSPATMTDTKAAIRYLRLNASELPAGNTDRIVITGTSGGGALSTVIAASGNNPDYYESLYEIGAAGIEKNDDGTYASVDGMGDDVYAVIGYCPITDFPNACAGYEWLFYDTRLALDADGKMNYSFNPNGGMGGPGGGQDAGTPLENAPLLDASAQLKALYEIYVDGLGLKDESGETITSENLGAHIEALMKKEIEESVTEFGVEQMRQDIAESAGEDNGWLVVNDDGTFTYDYEKHLYHLATRQTLKVPSAFSNVGLEIAGQNEDNLFGSREDEYSPFNAYAWDNDKKANGVGKDDTGLSWDEFMATPDGQRLALQIKMTSAPSYLQDGAEASDSAPYWYVRHGMMDRDTAWATEAILYYSALNNSDVKDLNFEFAWLKGHQGDYDVQEAYAWLKSIL